MSISAKRKRQVKGGLIGLIVTVAVSVFLSLPSGEEYLSKGELNTGHDGLECTDCHSKANGTLMQQLQANIQWAVGSRKTNVPFGTEDVDTKKCQGCHDRPNDRHPVHRFKEPRFADARKMIEATECQTCHLEHSGMRMTQTNIGFCVNCHQDLKMKNDPLDVSHAELIKNEQWTTCLQCHDFHGNHKAKPAEMMKDTINMEVLREYLEGGKDPFGELKKYSPKKKPEDELPKNY